MRNVSLLLILISLSISSIYAREPLYVVNGKVVSSIENIPHENIASIETLPANEETIAIWGTEASEGVIVVSLRYDTSATFSYDGYDNFTDYLAHNVKWSETQPAERVSLRIKIDAEGYVTVDEVLDSTSLQFLKRTTKAIKNAPRWSPATRKGEAVESIQLVNLKLPANKELPAEHAVILL